MPTVRNFLDRAKKDRLLVNADLERAIAAHVDMNKEISNSLEDILRGALKESNARESGVHRTAALIISTINNCK